MISDSNPVFVKIEKYKEITELIEVIDKRIGVAKQLLSDLEELKRQEDEEIAKWQASIEEVDHKMGILKDQLNEQ